MRSGVRWLILIALSMASIVVLGGVLLVWTAPGRDVLAGWIADFTNAKIPGSMKIGKLESIGFLRPVATDIEFFTPDGKRVLRMDKAAVHWNLEQLLRGKIGFHKARADGGEIIIAIEDGGRTNLQDAFKTECEDKIPLELDSIHFENMTVVLQMSGETRFIVRDVQGFLSVWRQDTPGVRVDLGRVRGIFEKPEMTGDKIELLRMEGQVWAQEQHVAALKLKTRIGNGSVDADFDYFDREENPAQLELRPETGSESRIAATAIESWFSDKLDVTIEN